MSAEITAIFDMMSAAYQLQQGADSKKTYLWSVWNQRLCLSTGSLADVLLLAPPFVDFIVAFHLGTMHRLVHI